MLPASDEYLSNNNEVAATFGPAKHWPQPIFLAEAWRSANGTLVRHHALKSEKHQGLKR